MKPLPIGIQTFRKLVEGNYLYVDKTKKIYSLIENASGSYFLSRPRRFGKSLTLSVLDEIFSANKELFRGLYIYDSPWEWKKYPVLRFDFSKQKAKNKEELIQFFFEELEDNSPNAEVRQAFLNYFLRKIHKRNIISSPTIKLYNPFQKEDVEEIFNVIKEVFTNIEYDLQIQQEKYYQTIFYLLFNLLGYYIQTEVKTNRDRIDAVVESKSIFIFEFKLNGSKEEALGQIKEKKYYERYISKGKKIYLLGVEFRDRNLGEYLVEIIPMSDMT